MNELKSELKLVLDPRPMEFHTLWNSIVFKFLRYAWNLEKNSHDYGIHIITCPWDHWDEGKKTKCFSPIQGMVCALDGGIGLNHKNIQWVQNF